MRRLVLEDRVDDRCDEHGYCSVMREAIVPNGRVGFRLVDVDLGHGQTIKEVRYVRGGRGELVYARVYVCPFCFGAPMARGRNKVFVDRGHMLMFKKTVERARRVGLLDALKEVWHEAKDEG